MVCKGLEHPHQWMDGSAMAVLGCALCAMKKSNTLGRHTIGILSVAWGDDVDVELVANEGGKVLG